MFRLFKDLTRPPESLDRSPNSPASQLSPATPGAGTSLSSGALSPGGLSPGGVSPGLGRSPGGHSPGGRSPSGHGGRSPSGRSSSISFPRSPSGSYISTAPVDPALLSSTASFAPEEDSEEDAEEDADPAAMQVIGLLHALQDETGTMYLVETFSELLSVPGTRSARRAFRLHGGFDRILDSLGALAWRERPADVDEEQWQVEEIQRAEAQRLCLEVLGWGVGDRAGARMFRDSYGYMSLLAPLRALAPTAPDARVLGLLLAYLFGNNYALLSVFGELDVSALEAQLGEIALRCADGLPLWWAYVCGLGGEDSGDLFPDALLTGDLEADPLVHATIQIFCLLSRQLPDALLLRKHLPRLPEFLFTRIYGREDPRPVQVTFPPRPEWYADADAEDVRPCPEWVAPGAELRALYAELLGNLLKGGVAPEQAWRLFELVRHVTPGTPASQDSETKPEPEEDESRRGPISRNLKVVIPETETLDDDILNMIHSLMPRCTPDMFVFRGHGGVELRDMAHAWPSSTRGFMFACWLNVQQVTEPITLLRLRQGADAQILLVRVLRNSQIGLTTDADEVVCGAPDALVPSSQWVHLAVACRKGRSALGGGGEARVYLNGRRVGAVRLAYPVVTERRPGIRVTIGSTDEEVNQDGDRHNGSTEWLLGRTLLVDEVLSEEIITLMYRLGSRYHGNLQEALNKFLTYAGATAIHLYLYEQSQGALPNSALVRALRTGPTIPEDTIMLSLCAKDMLDPDTVLNAAIPHAARARDFPNARARLHGAVFAYCGNDLDASIAAVGGGIVALKLVDLAKGNQLLTALEILRDMIKNSWSASEEMERIHGFDLLAAILRPKMASITVPVAEVLLSILGVEGEDATVHNSAAYRAIGLEFELWASAPLAVQQLYFDHFSLLLKSSHKRYNLLRTFQKSNPVRKLLFAIRQNLYELDVLPLAVATLRLFLTSRWSIEEAVKPVFAFLVSSLCSNSAPEPTGPQRAGAMVIQMMAEVLRSPKLLVKLNKALSLNRLLVVFLQSNPAAYVVLPCLDIVASCLSTPGLESFQRSFESEGGFTLLAKTLAPIWSASVQETVFRILFGSVGPAGAALVCPPIIPTILTAVDVLLQDPGKDGRLEQLLNKLAEVYRQSSALRRAINARKIETLLPNMVEFAVLSSSTSQRAAAVNFLTALIDLSKAPPTIITQLKLLVEQLRAPPARQDLTPTSPAPSSVHSPLMRSHPGALRRTLTGESLLASEHDKNAAWRQIILSSDAQKHAAMVLDRKEHWHRLGQAWPAKVGVLRGENGVWADRDASVVWRMDGSEGPLRMRGRLERVERVVHDKGGYARDAIPSFEELSSAVSGANSAPWEDPFALVAPTPPQEVEDGASVLRTPATPVATVNEVSDSEDYDEMSNKMRLVAKTLQAGDVVEEAYNIVRIVGVDALPGLLILGSRNLYLIDGLAKTADGKVIEANQATDVLSIPSGTLADFDPSDQRSHRWPYADVVESNKRAFLFRDVALELYFSDKQNFLVVFQDKRQRQAVCQKVQAKIDGGPLARTVIGSILLDTVARVRGDQLEDMTRRWQNREISNFAYLQMLNQHAGRTPNDVTQYPVFPWVLSDYTSSILDLSDPASYRDLSMPMGALTESRREAAVERYQATEGVGETPFHYGTHYSSSMIVCGYMIRVSPFTEIFLTLQGGSFDLADRLFSSIPRAWDSASNTNRGDVRELIPEFFYSPMFLVNLNHHNFGKKQVTGETVDDVQLPPWALGDPMLFVHWNREALESDYVSKHLPAWIDLTFGCKQRDPASYNCFHPLSYRGAVDLDRMKDAAEKAASTSIIHNFGQTPPQVLRQPHPSRFPGTMPVGVRFGVAEHWQLLLRSAMPILESNARIYHILDPVGDFRPAVQQQFRLVVPGHPSLSVQYGFADQSLRVYVQENVDRLLHIVEGIDVTHAAFASPTMLVTVSSLGIITAWRFSTKGMRRGDTSLVREATLCGARNVVCIAVSRAWSLLVTGSADGNAMVWDMNGLTYIRTLETPRNDSLRFMAVNEANGHIALASDRYLYMFSLNGHPIASTSIDDSGSPAGLPVLKLDNGEAASVHSGSGSGGDSGSPSVYESSHSTTYTGGIAFLKREFLRWGDLFVVGTGAQVALYRCVPGVRRFEDEDVEPWRLVKQGVLHGSDLVGSVTAVRFAGETLYAGIDTGTTHALHQWSLPDGPARHVPDSVGACMSAGCGARFGLLELRRHCGGCGGAFCGSHARHIEGFKERYCPTCLAVLAQGNSLGLLDTAGKEGRDESAHGARHTRRHSRGASLASMASAASAASAVSGASTQR